MSCRRVQCIGYMIAIMDFGVRRPHLVLVPGLMCDEAVWKDQARTLSTLTSVDVADHGALDSLGAMAEAILSRSPRRFALAGHSMGGRVALEVFRRAPDRIAGIALLDTAYAPFPAGKAGQDEKAQRYSWLEKARTEGVRAMGAVWVQRMVHPDRLRDQQLIDAILDMFERKTPDIFAAQIRALLERPDATPLLSEIRRPAMVLCGRQDTWSVLPQHERMASMIPGSLLRVIEDCGHMSTMERPQEVTAAMTEWLRSLFEYH
jgi:pimeloyl-ACP methyl ester carboxylesterase